MRTCPECSQLHSDQDRFCPVDGCELSEADPLLGTVLQNQFRVMERVGQGACGDVYRAYQLGVQREVAVKVLHSGAARSAEFVARFTREARAAARLSHAHIITVLSVGHTPSGLPFIAMEWLQGAPLGRAKSGRTSSLTPREVVVIARQIASALAEAHAAGIVHRDLKPDNVMLSRKHGQAAVTILDFGIAKVLDPELLSPGDSQLTRLGVVYGTPQYLSPEQAGAQTVDARSDLYSLGVMLYELLTGQLPFSSQGMSLLVDHISHTPTAIRELAPEVPVALADLVMQLLAKEPADRPQSALVLLQRLEAIESGPTRRRSQAPPLARPRSAPSLASALMGVFLFALSSGHIGGRMSVVQAAPRTVQTASSPVAERPAPTGPRRALMVSADGFALRVLMPEELAADRDQRIAIEIWGPDGRPLRSPSLVVVFADEDGLEHGVSAPASDTPGRYEIIRKFEHRGAHSMRVLPETTDVAMQVHFEVREAVNDPNS